MNPKTPKEWYERPYTAKLTRKEYYNFLRFQAMWDEYEKTFNSDFETARQYIHARELWGESVLNRLVSDKILMLIDHKSYETFDGCLATLKSIEEFIKQDQEKRIKMKVEFLKYQ